MKYKNLKAFNVEIGENYIKITLPMSMLPKSDKYCLFFVHHTKSNLFKRLGATEKENSVVEKSNLYGVLATQEKYIKFISSSNRNKKGLEKDCFNLAFKNVSIAKPSIEKDFVILKFPIKNLACGSVLSAGKFVLLADDHGFEIWDKNNATNLLKALGLEIKSGNQSNLNFSIK